MKQPTYDIAKSVRIINTTNSNNANPDIWDFFSIVKTCQLNNNEKDDSGEKFGEISLIDADIG